MKVKKRQHSHHHNAFNLIYVDAQDNAFVENERSFERSVKEEKKYAPEGKFADVMDRRLDKIPGNANNQTMSVP